MIAAGTLRHEVEVQVVRDVPEPLTGAIRPQPVTIATRRCSIEALSAREQLIAAQKQSRASLKVTMRVDGLPLTSKHRLVWNDRGRTRTFNIESVTDPDGLHVEQTCLVIEGGGP